jgi:hypothetical protein
MDNCHAAANPEQAGQDRAGVGKACDNCPSGASASRTAMGDNVGDTCDAQLGDSATCARGSTRLIQSSPTSTSCSTIFLSMSDLPWGTPAPFRIDALKSALNTRAGSAQKICDDALDHNCDGLVDEGLPARSAERGTSTGCELIELFRSGAHTKSPHRPIAPRHLYAFSGSTKVRRCHTCRSRWSRLSSSGGSFLVL